jgi:BMFP domain-containing protein YqiC
MFPAIMDPQHLLDDLAGALTRAFPAGFTREAEKNLRAMLQSAFARMDLVTREELEVQEQVLARTRAKLQELEKKIAELEEKLKN